MGKEHGHEHAPAERIRVGVSSCLLGDSVRYDGGHKYNRYITKVLSGFFEFVLACPEVAIGKGRLTDPVLRENFIARVYVYHRWQAMEAASITPAKLVEFHTRHKMLIR